MISVVIVNWNSGTLLERCVLSLQKNAPECEIIVVDNASEDFSLDFTTRAGASLTVIRNSENLGFAAGNNAGWQRSHGEQVLFLNPDTECKPNSVNALSQLLTDDATVWAAGGRLIHPTDSSQTGYNVRAFPSIASVAAEMLLLDELWPGNPWTARYRMSRWDHLSRREVDQPAAACLMVRRAAMEHLGGFDESFRPAWFEDVDLCRRIHVQGGRILFEPRAEFLHHGGTSLRYLARDRFLRFYHTNQIRYFRKHHGAAEAQRVRRIVCAGLYLRSLLSLVYPLVRGASRISSARTFLNSARHFRGKPGDLR